MPSNKNTLQKGIKQKAIDYLIGERLSYSAKMTILLIIVVAFPVISQLLVPFVDVESLRILTVLPVIITSAFFGAKVGLVFIVYVFVFSYVVFRALGVEVELTTPNLLILSASLALVGYVIGSASDLTREQKKLARTLKTKESTYRVIYNAVQQYMETGDFGQTMVDFLERLGKRIGVSRAYLFRNEFKSLDDNNPIATQLYEWSAEGVQTQIDNPEMRAFDVRKFGMIEIFRTMKEQGYVAVDRSEFPQQTTEEFVGQDILSFLNVPVFVKGKFWGFVGFDETSHKRDWSAEEIDVLKLAASVISSFVINKEGSQELKEKAKELQDMNDVLVGRELEMKKLKEELSKQKTAPNESKT